MKRRALVALALFAAGAASAQSVTGTRPTYFSGDPGSPPNHEAMDRRFWAPGLDEGYVPQGISYADGLVLLSAYRSADRSVGSGPTRVYALDAATGAERARFDLPAGFTHAGGLAVDRRSGKLYVADTRKLLRVDLARALKGDGAAAFEKRWDLGGVLRGSFAAYHDGRVWIGEWNPRGSGRIHAIPLAALEAASVLTEAQATASLGIPERGQGAAFHPDGSLWTAHSSSRFGELLMLEAKTGKVLARYDAPIGIEDLSFDPQGRLWSVSEAGSRRWLDWSLFFPLVFRIDPAKLR